MLDGPTLLFTKSTMKSGLPPQSMVQWLVTLFFWNFYYPNVSLPSSPHPF